jgi:hypothetical protein
MQLDTGGQHWQNRDRLLGDKLQRLGLQYL